MQAGPNGEKKCVPLEEEPDDEEMQNGRELRTVSRPGQLNSDGY